jgi:peptide/nickel transport system substrate-binding protein
LNSSDKHVERLVDEYASRRIDRRQFVRRAAALGLSLPAVSALIAACGGGGGGAAGGGGGGLSKTLRIRLTFDVQNMDPATWVGQTDEAVFCNVCEGLVTYKPGTLEVVNQLAETFTPSADHLSYEFTLKQGVPFHGGFGEVTSEDVKFSFERIAGLTKPKLESAYAGDWSALKEVKIKDKYSGTIVLKEPFAALLSSTLPVNAGMIVSKKAVEQMGKKHATHPIGTGPYEFVAWKPNQRVELRRFKDYATAFSNPQWDEIILRPIAQDSAGDTALETGELDFAQISLQSIDRFKGNSDFQVADRTTFDFNFIGMNVLNPKLSDINVRQAIRAAIDVDAILQAGFEGKWTRATAIIPPGMELGYWKDAPVYKPDVARAKQFLAQSSSPPSELSFMYTEETGSDAVFEISQANLNEIGITLNGNKVESAVFYELGKQMRQREMFYTGYVSEPDPSWSTVWFLCDQFDQWNWMYSCDERFDQLHHDALREFDAAKRDAMYVEMQERWDARADAIWTAWPTNWFAWKDGLKPALTPHGRVVPYAFTTV